MPGHPYLKEKPLARVQDHTGFSDTSSQVPRLHLIEGLRSYLALWVLWTHALWLSGYQMNALGGLPESIYKLLALNGDGGYASMCSS